MSIRGHLRRLIGEAATPAHYVLCVGDQNLVLNPLLGQTLKLEFTGEIRCIACGQVTPKSFSQGYCYPCSQQLARCDLCVLRPDRCHFYNGTCREPEWGLSHCMQPHIVYLANTSGLKVGISRANNVPARWIDQGATQALPVLEVNTRQQSGLLEVALAAHVSDRTNWRVMLKGSPEPIDLVERRDAILKRCSEQISELRRRFGANAIRFLAEALPASFQYPVLDYPRKVSAFNFDKAPVVVGKLTGIKGQYLIFEERVLNVRKFSGYRITVSQ